MTFTMTAETAQDLWDYLEEWVWPFSGEVVEIKLEMSETNHAYLLVAFTLPNAD